MLGPIAVPCLWEKCCVVKYRVFTFDDNAILNNSSGYFEDNILDVRYILTLQVIDVDITQLNTHTTCEKEGLRVYDGLSNQKNRLWNACKQGIRSTGTSMMLQVSTDGDIAFAIKYRSVKIGNVIFNKKKIK